MTRVTARALYSHGENGELKRDKVSVSFCAEADHSGCEQHCSSNRKCSSQMLKRRTIGDAERKRVHRPVEFISEIDRCEFVYVCMRGQPAWSRPVVELSTSDVDAATEWHALVSLRKVIALQDWRLATTMVIYLTENWTIGVRSTWRLSGIGVRVNFNTSLLLPGCRKPQLRQKR